MKKNLLTGFVRILLLILCVSAAFAEDAEQNLAEYGLNPQDILLEKIKFLPDENGHRQFHGPGMTADHKRGPQFQRLTERGFVMFPDTFPQIAA